MLLRILAEETGIGEIHCFRYLADRKRRLAQVMLEFGYRDISDPLAGGLTATLLAYLRQIFRRDIKLLCVPLYLALVWELT